MSTLKIGDTFLVKNGNAQVVVNIFCLNKYHRFCTANDVINKYNMGGSISKEKKITFPLLPNRNINKNG